TLLFAFWDGEEKGLLGSTHWVSAPTWPLTRIKLVINADMIGRLRSEGVEVTGTRVARGLRRLVAESNSSLTIRTGAKPAVLPESVDSETDEAIVKGVSATNAEANDMQLTPKVPLDFTWQLRADSDHHPFIAAGVPALMLHTGKHDDYHRPSDDADKLNYEGIQRVSRLMLLLALRAAETDELSPFRPAGRSETEVHQRQIELPLAAPASRLGIAWQPDFAKQRIVEVTTLVPKSPADEASLRVGDRIRTFGGHAVGDFADFRTLVMTSPEVTTATVERLDEAGPRTLSVRLAGEPTRLGLTWRTDDAEPNCVILTQVLPHSPADHAGLKPQDRVLWIGDQPIPTSDSFRQYAQSLPSPIRVTFERGGVIQVTTIEAAPDAK
ncbi:MAG TPA: M28 family peptidase, partial [Planctomycetaceae bacterium]|nr:M28 family peptidase [Planctomycetaceae bacterium]